MYTEVLLQSLSGILCIISMRCLSGMGFADGQRITRDSGVA